MNKRRRQEGLSRIRSQAVNIRPHPSRGGSRGYDRAFRENQLLMSTHHLPTTRLVLCSIPLFSEIS